MGNSNPKLPPSSRKSSQKHKIKAGDVFGDLTATGESFKDPVKKCYLVPVVCVCGKKYFCFKGNLLKGHSRSCGCMRSSRVTQFLTRHGETHTRLYDIWVGMRQRCSDSKNIGYHRYGGRGITVCAEWQSYETFRDWALNNGYQDNLSLDRINNDGNYEPSNCRWATQRQQCNNTSKTRFVTAFGETKTVSEWLQDSRCVVPRHAIHKRITIGWTAEDALILPLNFTRRRKNGNDGNHH